MKKYKTKNKNRFLKEIINGLSILFIASLMLFGLKVYSASENSLTFAQISDAHYSTAKTNTSYRLTAESAELLDDAVTQVNETPKYSIEVWQMFLR